MMLLEDQELLFGIYQTEPKGEFLQVELVVVYGKITILLMRRQHGQKLMVFLEILRFQ